MRLIATIHLNTEIWKDVEGFEGYYQISNLGNVRSLDRKVRGRYGDWLRKGKIMSPKTDKDGYKSITFRKDGRNQHFQVHRLVAAAFIPNPENKPQVNHFDGIKDHNHYLNLEWVTFKENIHHAFGTGLMHGVGSSHYKSRLTDEQIAYIRKVYVKGDKKFGQGALARKFGTGQSTISGIVNNKTHKLCS